MNAARLLLDTLRFRQCSSQELLVAEWVRADVRGVRRLVEFEGCSIWAYRRLRRLGVLGQIDPELAEWLTAHASHGTARNMLIDAEAEALADVLHRLAIPSVFLKGVARRLAAQRYPLADARTTNDVDVLVPADRAWELWRELRRLGYGRTKLSKPPRPEHHHLPALWCARRVGVEIHTTHAQGIPPEESWRRHYAAGTDVVRAGKPFRIPSATELFWSCTAHALLIPDTAFVLVRLLDAAVVWASEAAVDWSEIARRLDAKEIVDSAAAAAWLRAAADLAGVDLPVELSGRIAPYNLDLQLQWRLAVLKRMQVPPLWRKALIWLTSDHARRAS